MNFAEFKKQTESAGGIAWIEELLIRGQPGGGIKGGHAIYGQRVAGIAGTAGPFSLATDVNDNDFAAVLSAVNVDAVNSLADAITAKESAEQTAATLQARVDELEAAAAPTPGVFSVRDVIGKMPAEKLALAFNAALASPPLLQFFLLMLADTGIRADDPRTVAGLAAFVQSGLLTEAEAAALFAE